MQAQEEKTREASTEEVEESSIPLDLLVWDYDSSYMWKGYFPRSLNLADEKQLNEAKQYVRKVVLLNALVPPPYNGVVSVKHVNMDEAKRIIDKLIDAEIPVESYIGHEATAQLLTQQLGIPVPLNRGMYKPQPGDVAFVFRLKKRLEKPEDVKNITPEDLDVLYAYYA